MLDPSLKLEYIPMDEQEYIMQHLENLHLLMPAPPTSSTCTQGETLLSNSTACSKMMVELIKRKRKRNMNIVLERQISMKYLIICMTLQLRVLILMLYNGGVKLVSKNIHDLQY